MFFRFHRLPPDWRQNYVVGTSVQVMREQPASVGIPVGTRGLVDSIVENSPYRPLVVRFWVEERPDWLPSKTPRAEVYEVLVRMSPNDLYIIE